MAKQTLNIIKNWFKTGLKPTQAQFWDTWDSFWQKDEKIPTASVDGLNNILTGKASQEGVNSSLASIRDDITIRLEDKVGKVDGASLVPDTEIAKIHAAGSDDQDLSGFVVGPDIAANNVICVFDGATGKLIKLTNVAISENGELIIIGGEVTLLGKKALRLPTGIPTIDAGLSVRLLDGESIVQFGNNLSDYYTGAINQSKSGSMIRLDTRDAAPTPGGHAYSAFQIQVRPAGAAYTAYKVPVQISGGALEGALCIGVDGILWAYYGIKTARQIQSTLPDGGIPPMLVASKTLVPNLNADLLDGLHGVDYQLKLPDSHLVRILTFDVKLTAQNIADAYIVLQVDILVFVGYALLFVDGVKQRRHGDGGDYPADECDYGTFTSGGLLQIKWNAPYLLAGILEVGDVLSLQIGVHY